jgi:hypothetical protein
MSLLHAQDSLLWTGIEAEQTAFAIFRPLNADMTMKV